jgi:thiol-disulfide isomerase/thioredoxin
VALVAALVVALVVGLAWRATNGKIRAVPAAAGLARPASAQATAQASAQTSAPPALIQDTTIGNAMTGDTAAGDTATAARRVTAADLGRPLGERATLLQFSSAFCAPCRATRVILADVAGRAPGVAHVEIDAESHLDLVRSLGVLRPPTLFILAADGAITARASGQPRKADVLAALPAGTSYSPGLETG